MVPGTACPQAHLWCPFRVFPAPHSHGPAPCPLPQCQCCGLLILTYSSPTCQDERQEMGSSSSHSRSGQTTLHHISRPVMGSWRQTRRGLTSGTALTGRRTPRTEPLLTTDCRQPCSLALLPVAEATFSEGHSHWGSPLPRGACPRASPLPASHSQARVA